MDANKKDLKLKDYKAKGTLESPQYVLTYKQSKSDDESRKTSYEILSAMKTDGDAVIELNSNLFMCQEKLKDDIIFKFIENAKKTGLDYRYRKIANSGTSSIFGKILSRAKSDAHEIIVYVPCSIWESESFSDMIFLKGARYYFTGNSPINTNLLEEMYRMTDIEKLNFFKLIVFDMNDMGHMGINTGTLEFNDVKKLLGLD
jgi:hypothetical protein